MVRLLHGGWHDGTQRARQQWPDDCGADGAHYVCSGEKKGGAPQGTAARPPRPALRRSLETRYRRDRAQPRAIGEMVPAAASIALRARGDAAGIAATHAGRQRN